jgi:hypothetical protein
MFCRRLTSALVLCLVLAGGSRGLAQDSVILKGNQQKPLPGKIADESPAGIKLEGRKELIRADDIEDVTYGLPAELKIDVYTPAQTLEKAIDKAKDRKKAFADAIQKYQLLVKRLKGKSYPNARRHFQYKVAALTARSAQEDPGAAARAITLLKQFKDKHPDGWQIARSLRLLGQLLVEKKSFGEAQKVFEQAAGNKNLPEPTRNAFQLEAARVLMRGKKFDEANTKLQAIVDKVKDERQKNRALICQAECLAALDKVPQAREKLETLLGKIKADKELRAQAHNALGYVYYLSGRHKKALWEFLRVDVVYYQNPEEHARALYYLARLFKRFKDADRARECREKLAGKKYSGTDYQRMALAEGKKGR